MDIAILTPVEVEYKVVRQFLTGLRSKEIDGFEYELGHFSGNFHNYSIVIRQTGSKNEDISLATEKIIQNFKPSIILLVGIAGGVKDVVIGDVVVGLKAYGYESGKETPEGTVIRPDVIPYDFQLIEKARTIARNQAWQERISYSKKDIKVVFGPIASGNKVIASTESPIYKIIKKHFNDTTALEMEAIGFAKAVLPHRDIRTMNIRGISDLLDNKSKSDAEGTQEDAVHNAAAFAFELLSQLDFLNLKIYALNMQDLVDKLTELALPLISFEVSNEKGSDLNNSVLESLWNKISPFLMNQIDDLRESPDDEGLLKDLPVLVKNDLRRAVKHNSSLKEELENLVGKIDGLRKDGDIRIEKSKNIINQSNINVKGDFRLGDDYQ